MQIKENLLRLKLVHSPYEIGCLAFSFPPPAALGHLWGNKVPKNLENPHRDTVG